ncbi:uncharacterized protein METZ01_LOCUS77626 [marine metagenome]|uniref:Uncharacterized protein n=1 Tax=marine metagenome TaxID=408172 RepID=A0A381U967_9ZZZZ
MKADSTATFTSNSSASVIDANSSSLAGSIVLNVFPDLELTNSPFI